MTTEREPLERVTINLIPRASKALDAVTKQTGDSKTDAVNNALRLYALVLDAQANGQDVLLRTPGREELEKIVLM